GGRIGARTYPGTGSRNGWNYVARWRNRTQTRRPSLSGWAAARSGYVLPWAGALLEERHSRRQPQLAASGRLRRPRTDHHVGSGGAHVPEPSLERIAAEDRARRQRAVHDVHGAPARGGRVAGGQAHTCVQVAEVVAALGGIPQPRGGAVQVLARRLHQHE